MIKEQLASLQELQPFLFHRELIEIVGKKTGMSSAGFPYVSEDSFEQFIQKIPHLFSDANQVIQWISLAKKNIAAFSECEEKISLSRSLSVIETVVHTAAITSVPDLWIIRQILSSHKILGIVDILLCGNVIEIQSFCREHSWSEKVLKADFHLLLSRGLLCLDGKEYRLTQYPQAKDIYSQILPIESKFRVNNVALLVKWFRQPDLEQKEYFSQFFQIHVSKKSFAGWYPSYYHVELGYRLLPLLLSLRVLNYTKQLKAGIQIDSLVPNLLQSMKEIMRQAGWIDDAFIITSLGERVFERGSGPFGIIGAYLPYTSQLDKIITQTISQSHVNRGANVAASQDANRKTFSTANDSLDTFCKDYHFKYSVFIEHAIGQGEATRQRFEKDGEKTIQYFGADLEDDALEKAKEQQKLGYLPQNMKFISHADIGEPQKVISAIQSFGFSTELAVMMVGNGFHEIRRQTNEKMIHVFEEYQKAGMIVIFTEETGLSDQDLLSTAFNTYHAGFRYVHELSGQGLRPAFDTPNDNRYSWKKCAELAGYQCLDTYTTRTRSIYPYPKKDGYNPCISMNYFCVPSIFFKKYSADIKI